MDYQPYTGVGSRKTPQFFLDCFEHIALELSDRGYTLRSGGADGADLAFEEGAGDEKEIFLPWRGFNGSDSLLHGPIDEAYHLASTIHPRWTTLKPGAQSLHARNCQQVLGRLLDDPSLFLLCWTEGGLPTGGTATAIKLAYRHKIPVLNFGGPEICIGSLKEAWELVEPLL